jgi:Fur family transcriptional regulator, ferric uptake regulator
MPHASKAQSISADYLERGVARFRAKLRARAMKLPKARAAVARCALQQTGNFCAVDLVEALKAEGEAEAHAVTVYRTMPLLVEAGLLRTAPVARGDSQYYEVAFEREAQPRLMCRKCGRSLEFTSSAIEALQCEISQRFGFELEVCSSDLRGRCNSCRATARRSQRL